MEHHFHWAVQGSFNYFYFRNPPPVPACPVSSDLNVFARCFHICILVNDIQLFCVTLGLVRWLFLTNKMEEWQCTRCKTRIWKRMRMVPFAFLCCCCHQERSILVISERGDYWGRQMGSATILTVGYYLVWGSGRPTLLGPALPSNWMLVDTLDMSRGWWWGAGKPGELFEDWERLWDAWWVTTNMDLEDFCAVWKGKLRTSGWKL